MELTRRDFLKGTAATGLAALLPACTTKEPYTLEFKDTEYVEGKEFYALVAQTGIITNNTNHKITLTKYIEKLKAQDLPMKHLWGSCKYVIEANSTFHTPRLILSFYSAPLEGTGIIYQGTNEIEEPVEISHYMDLSKIKQKH